MTVRKALAVALAGAWVLASTGLAQQADQPERPRRTERPQRPARPRALNPRQFLEQALRQLDLDAGQKVRVQQILNTHQQEVDNWRKQYGEDLSGLRDQLAKAREEKDEKAIRELTAKRAKITQQRNRLQEKLALQIAEVLKGQQKERFVPLVLRNRRMLVSQAGRIRLVLTVFDLRKAQKDLAGKIIDRAAGEAAKAQGPRATAELWRKATDEIRKKVLTPDQVAKFDRLLRSGRGRDVFAALNLTEAQRKQVNDIMAEARKKVQEAGPDQRRTIWQEAMQKIRAEVLTGAQREQLRNRPPRAGRERPARPNRPE